VAGYIWHGLQRGHKVVYFRDGEDTAEFGAELAALDPQIEAALARAQLEVKPAGAAYLPGGVFDPDEMLATVRAEHARALAEGYSGASLTGEMTWALGCRHGADRLPDYERSLDDLTTDDSLVLFCQYDHSRFGDGPLAEAAAQHHVDVAPELAGIGRCGYLAAAFTRPGPTLRLAGEIDADVAGTLAETLHGQAGGHVSVDLADVEYVDVAAMRALRGHDRRLTIAGASECVRRLVGLLAWDTDPAVEILEPA
jgi:ABC-type transporter Mla MlaB component